MFMGVALHYAIIINPMDIMIVNNNHEVLANNYCAGHLNIQDGLYVFAKHSYTHNTLLYSQYLIKRL